MKFEYNLEYPNELNNLISEECYICGRSNDDLKTLRTRNIDAQIKRFENALVELKERYNKSVQEILESTKENNFLDIQINTITEDFDTFRKKIPYLNEFLEPFSSYCHDYSELEKYRGKNFRYIWNMYKEKMENNPDNCPAIVKIKQNIANLNKEKLHLQEQEVKNEFESMHLLKSRFQNYEIAICPICYNLIDQKGALVERPTIRSLF